MPRKPREPGARHRSGRNFEAHAVRANPSVPCTYGCWPLVGRPPSANLMDGLRGARTRATHSCVRHGGCPGAPKAAPTSMSHTHQPLPAGFVMLLRRSFTDEPNSHFFIVARAASTSSLCALGLTPVHTRHPRGERGFRNSLLRIARRRRHERVDHLPPHRRIPGARA